MSENPPVIANASRRDVSGHGPTLSARAVSPANLDPGMIEAWVALEKRALDGNAFLSPHFVKPALAHLGATGKVRIVLVESTGADKQLAGLGIFENVSGNRHFPLPHLRAYRSPHSFLSGMLVDAAWGDAVPAAMFNFIKANDRGRTAIYWDRLACDGWLGRTLRAGGDWYEESSTTRALLVPPNWGKQYLEEHLSGDRKKSLRRRERELEKIAPLQWRLLHGDAVDERCIDTFLQLENSGWRHERGASMIARQGHEVFFRAMAGGFAGEGRIFFTELVLGEKVIASSSNLLHGNAAFAFKLGWDTSYSSMAPGMLNEVELVRRLPDFFPDLESFDSCAAQGSFLESLYLERREIASGCIALSGTSRTLLKGISRVRGIKRQLASKR